MTAPGERARSAASRAERAPMVRWYDPGQLARTACDVVVSTVLGRHVDVRLNEVLAGTDIPLHDWSGSRESWVDYVADTGDGFDSTFAVARACSLSTLEVTAAGGERVSLPSGEVLVLGGDEVYPVASRAAYEKRLVAPFSAALPWTKAPHPRVLALPGNHDWYDSLMSFMRLFCRSKPGRTRWLGGRQTCQSRSYFAVKLPGSWWLLGTDVQLGADIDEAQLDFFQDVVAGMAPEERVVLCNAIPEWVYRQKYGSWDERCRRGSLLHLEREVLKDRVKLVIAGDLHHYRRHVSTPDRPLRITCGGGGAFLHPTHDSLRPPGDDTGLRAFGRRAAARLSELLGGGLRPHPDDKEALEMRAVAAFPPASISRRLTWRNVLFALRNWRFSALIGIGYVMAAWGLLPEQFLLTGRLSSDWLALAHDHVIRDPGCLLGALVLLGAFLLFTDTHSLVYRLWAGGSHGLLHLALAVGAGGLAAFGVRSLVAGAWLGTLLWCAAVLLVGWLAGGTLLGLYLVVSANLFGRQTNEAFSSLACPDWKSFLRLRFGDDGTLRVHVIGIDRVPRRWKSSLENDGPVFEPDDPEATEPRLVDEVLEWSPRSGAWALAAPSAKGRTD